MTKFFNPLHNTVQSHPLPTKKIPKFDLPYKKGQNLTPIEKNPLNSIVPLKLNSSFLTFVRETIYSSSDCFLCNSLNLHLRLEAVASTSLPLLVSLLNS